jgi:methionyl-tRNA formyltransferase
MILSPGEASLDNPSTPLVIGTGDGLYAPEQLQLAGRKTLDVTDFVNGNQSIAGAVLRQE